MPENVPIVPEALAFRFQHGAQARSLPEFADVLSSAPLEVVWYHRGHYASWLREVLHEVALARRFESYAEGGGDPDVYRETVTSLLRRRVEGPHR